MNSIFELRRRTLRRVGLLAAGLGLAVPTALVGSQANPPVASAAETLSQTFTFNDTTQYFTVPAGVTNLNVLADGGDGGGSNNYLTGGAGTEVSGSVSVNPGDTIVVEVGGAGSAGNSENGIGTAGGAGGLSSGDGMNGGAGGSVYFGVDGAPAGGGGGGTEVVDATSGTVLAVAGGGGGAGGGGAYSGYGGAGGGGTTDDAVDPGGQGTSSSGAGGAGGPGGESQGPAGQNGGTPNHGELSGGGGGGGGGYYNPSQDRFGGGDAGAGGGWSAYEGGGGGGGAGSSYEPPNGVIGLNTSSTNGQVVLSWSAPSTATITSLAFSSDHVTAGQSYTAIASVQGLNTSPPTGAVDFFENGLHVATVSLNGDSPDTASFAVTAPSTPGTVSWQASYEGDNGATNAPGDSASSSATTLLTVVAAPRPEVTSVAPRTGHAGTTVTVGGTNLSGATMVLFGTKAAKTFDCTSSTACSAVAPKGVTGTIDVRIVTRGGKSPTNAKARFSYST